MFFLGDLIRFFLRDLTRHNTRSDDIIARSDDIIARSIWRFNPIT